MATTDDHKCPEAYSETLKWTGSWLEAQFSALLDRMNINVVNLSAALKGQKIELPTTCLSI